MSSEVMPYDTDQRDIVWGMPREVWYRLLSLGLSEGGYRSGYPLFLSQIPRESERGGSQGYPVVMKLSYVGFPKNRGASFQPTYTHPLAGLTFTHDGGTKRQKWGI